MYCYDILRIMDIVINMNFGAWVKQTRVHKGFSTARCARISGIYPSQWSRMEADEPTKTDGSPPTPKYETVEKVARALGVPVLDALEVAFPSGYMGKLDIPIMVQEDRARYLDKDGRVVKEVNPAIEMLEMMTGVVERLESIERRIEDSPPTTLIDLDGKGGQKVIVLSEDIQKQIAELTSKVDLLLKKSEDG